MSASFNLQCRIGSFTWKTVMESPKNRTSSLHFYRFYNRKSILKFYTEISNAAVHLRGSQEHLDGAQVACFLANLRELEI
jgi:hypothetical protein